MGRRKKQELPFEHWQIIELLHITQDFYSKPENEAAFQEWKAARDARKAKRPAGAGLFHGGEAYRLSSRLDALRNSRLRSS